jgi:hypothetical protein
MKYAHLLIGLGLLAAGCASTGSSEDPFADMFGGVTIEKSERIAATVAGKPLGSAENPVRANMPPGQRAYLSRLRCADGQAPSFQRMGSMGDGPYGMIMDGYEVVCAGSTPATSVIYIDMYHPTHVETQAPAGFTIVAP